MTTLETKPTSKERAATTLRAGRPRPFRPHVIRAVFKRNFFSYFSNPAGYVFITLFVFVSSCVAFWRTIFFTNNLANLDQLNRYMPYLLLLFIPAITMSLVGRRAAAGDRRAAADAAGARPRRGPGQVPGGARHLHGGPGLLAVARLHPRGCWATPDLGVLFATYLGYWLMGVLLIAIGMVASLLSSNVTVAFILGALFCAIPIFLG